MTTRFRLSARCTLLLMAFTLIPVCPTGAQVTITPGTPGKALPQSQTFDPTFTIAILGDRTAGQEWGLPYLSRAVEDLNRIAPEAVFSIGDMVQGYTRNPDRYERQAEQYLDMVRKLRAPFFPLPGNHDVISGRRDPADHEFEQHYEQRFGPLYYSAQFDPATVIVLYTDEALESSPHFSDTQIDWMRTRIDAAVRHARPLIVMMHKPAWRYRDSRWDEMHAMLAGARAQNISVLVLAGHFHSLQRDPDRDGVQYHLIGACGGMIDQHPLAGQLQHYTIVKVAADGDVHVYHQPVGSTLPPDFVLADDQARVFKLKNSDNALVVNDALDQPIGQPVNAQVQITLTNPIDVPIRVSGALVTAPPRPQPVEGWSIVDRTPVDIFNPYVTDANTPFRQAGPIEPFTLQPGQSRQIAMRLTCEPQPAMTRPPQIDFTASFTDSQGRDVPVYVRRRVPLRQRAALGPLTSIDMIACAWTCDVYDHFEPDPEIGLSVSDGRMNIALVARDDVPCYNATDDVQARIENPVSDAVLVRIGSGDAQRLYLVEPMQSDSPDVWRVDHLAGGENTPSQNTSPTLTREPRIDAQTIRSDGGYGMMIHIPIDLVGQPGSEIPFNIEIADNDDTYHTQWRRWAPRAAQSTVILPRDF